MLLLLISCGYRRHRESQTERDRERGEKSHSVTLHAENHPVTAHNQLTPFHKIMHALEVAAATDGREAAFPEKEEKASRKPHLL